MERTPVIGNFGLVFNVGATTAAPNFTVDSDATDQTVAYTDATAGGHGLSRIADDEDRQDGR